MRPLTVSLTISLLGVVDHLVGVLVGSPPACVKQRGANVSSSPLSKLTQ